VLEWIFPQTSPSPVGAGAFPLEYTQVNQAEPLHCGGVYILHWSAALLQTCTARASTQVSPAPAYGHSATQVLHAHKQVLQPLMNRLLMSRLVAYRLLMHHMLKCRLLFNLLLM